MRKESELARETLRLVLQYTDGQIPYGLLTEIANLFGISRERVRQLSLAEDTIPSRTQTLKRYCLICGKEKQSWQKKYCSMKCAHQGNLLRLPLVNCHNCKKEFRAKKITSGNANPIKYCSLDCYHAYARTHRMKYT